MHVAQVIPLRGPSQSQVTDAELVRRTLAGEHSASRELFERYLSLVHGLVFRLAPRDHEFEDLVQDSFISAFKHLPKLADPQAFAGWVRAHCLNTVRHRMRKRGLLRRLGLYRPEPLSLDFIAPSAQGDVVSDLHRLYAALDRLPADTRIMVVLSRVEGLSYDEIARELGVSLSTVKRRMRNVDEDLARALAQRRTPGEQRSNQEVQR